MLITLSQTVKLDKIAKQENYQVPHAKQTIFISHAAPEDNEFARWLSLQLIGWGYNVWCDIIKLKGGEDFWVEIENELRNNATKFLYILTKNSNQREGTLKELAVAQKVKKQFDPKM